MLCSSRVLLVRLTRQQDGCRSPVPMPKRRGNLRGSLRGSSFGESGSVAPSPELKSGGGAAGRGCGSSAAGRAGSVRSVGDACHQRAVPPALSASMPRMVPRGIRAGTFVTAGGASRADA